MVVTGLCLNFCYRSESHLLGMMHLTKDPCLVIGRAVSDCVSFKLHYAVSENIHTTPQKGLGFPGVGVCKTKNLKKYMEVNWNFQRGYGMI